MPSVMTAPEVAAMIRDAFHRAKKQATIVILLDTSGSMQGVKMTNAISATVDFLTQLGRDDEVFVYEFNDAVTALEPGGTAREVEERLSETLRALTAHGGTALYDAVCQGSQRIAVEGSNGLREVQDVDGQKAEVDA